MPILSSYAAFSAAFPKSRDSIPAQCQNCAKYSQVLSNSLHDILEIHQFANTMVTCSETQWNLNMRRASTFNLLHEAAFIKELQNKPDPDLQSLLSSSSDGNINAWAKKAERNRVRFGFLPDT